MNNAFENALADVVDKLAAQRADKTEKKPRLFYYEHALDCWIPAHAETESILDMFDEDDEIIHVEFKRIDMTDEEFENMPEVS